MYDLEKLLIEKNIFIPKDFDKYRIFLVEAKDRQFDMLENTGIIHVLSGNIKIAKVSKDIYLERNDLYILNKDCPHIVEGLGSKNIALVIEIKDEYLREYLNKDDYYFSNEMNTLEKKMIIGILGKLFVDSMDDILPYDEKEVVLEKLLGMLNLTEYREKRVEKDNIKNMVYEIAEYILRDYLSISQKNMTLEDISKEYNISYHYLSRSFKKYLGENYTDFLLRVRLEKALDLILNTDEKIIYISETSGFNSVKAFNVAFKKAFNLSPTEFKHKFENNKKGYYREDLYQDENTQKFIDDIKYLKHFNILKNNDLYYKIDLNKSKPRDFSKKDLTMDINCLFDISKNLHLLSRAVRDLDISRLIVDISIEDDGVYLLNKGKPARRLTSVDINDIINIVDENEIELLVFLNYFDGDITNNVREITNIVTGTLGLNGLGNFIFGLKIENIIDRLEDGGEDLYNMIVEFEEALKNRYEHIKYRWALSIDRVETLEDIEALNRLLKKTGYPEVLVAEINYEHKKDSVENSIDENLEIIRDLNSIARKINKDMEILMDFHYCLDRLDLIHSKKLIFSEFYFLEMILKSKSYEVDITSMGAGYSESRENDIDMLLYNNLGIKTSKFYISEYIRELGNKLVYEDKGILITESNEDLTIMIYDDYKDFYNNYKGYNITLNEHDNNHYTFELGGLEGRYKIIEYNVDSRLDERKNNLEYSEYENWISANEKRYLESNMTPRIRISFKDVHKKLSYKAIKKFGDIVLIKILPI